MLAVGWLLFLVDRWLLPEGPRLTEIWLTIVGVCYILVGVAAARGSRAAIAALPWAAAALGVWGMVTLVGLSADTTSSRTWMWSSLFSFVLGTLTLAVTAVPVDRRPSAGVVAYLSAALVVGGAGVGQIFQCRPELQASWCDPRFEQEERILASLESDRAPERAGHFGGPTSPATASFVFDEPPDPLTSVAPPGALPVAEADGAVEWEFGGDDDDCVGASFVQAAVGGYELRFSVDCRP